MLVDLDLIANQAQQQIQAQPQQQAQQQALPFFMMDAIRQALATGVSWYVESNGQYGTIHPLGGLGNKYKFETSDGFIIEYTYRIGDPPGQKLDSWGPLSTFFDDTAKYNHVKGRCTCDFHSVIMVTGCKCGGT